jgi:hypothetical protein
LAPGSARQRAGRGEVDPQLKAQLQKYAERLEDFRASLVASKEGGMITGERKLREKLGELYGGVNGSIERPTQSQLERKDVLQKQLEEAKAKLDSLTTKDLKPLNAGLDKAKVEPLQVLSQEDWNKKQR